MKQKAKDKIKRTKTKIKEIKTGIKKEIRENFFNVPNTITIFRLILVFFVVYMVFNNFSNWSIAIVFGFAAATDWLDGFFARRLKQTTKIGARLDQITDRIFTLIIVIALLIFFNAHYQDKIILLFLISSREIIGSLGFVVRLIRNIDAYEVKYIGKLTTFFQSFSIAFIIVGFSWSLYPAIATCILGIISGFDYIKDSIK